jgi:tetratricopeptide (TPR) repeat protein
MPEEDFSAIGTDDQRPSSIRHLLLPLSVIAAGLLAYHNSFAGTFVFDDRLHILGERRLNVLWPLWEALARRRPVVDYTLGINYAVGGDRLWVYHAVNVSIHILAGLTLFGVVRRTLLQVQLRERFGKASSWLAAAAGMIWVAHPLQTQSVTYLIQRAESLMGLLYLLTLYCVIRGAQSGDGKSAPARAVAWYLAAVLSCALGMGSKAVMVTAPIVVLLYDHAFMSQSFSQVFRRRWGLYAGLSATWGVLWACGLIKGVLNTSNRTAHVGFGYKDITPLQYALTQFGVLVQYLKLSIWPHPLCLDYSWPVARTLAATALPAAAITVLLGATLWALLRKPRLGFPGAWFFVILAPTSSFIPIKDVFFEHRMYLSLAGVVVAAVLGGDQALRYLEQRLALESWTRRVFATAGVGLIAATLVCTTARRNQDYHNEVAMWRDVLTKRPSSGRAAENLGTALVGEGRMDDAVSILRDAVQLHSRSATAHNSLGFALVGLGRLDEAVPSFREALRLKPTFSRAYLNLGNALSDLGKREEAIELYRTALRLRPTYSEVRLNLGNALLKKHHVEQAIEQYREIVRTDADNAKAWGNLGFALLKQAQGDDGVFEEALQALQKALAINPRAHNVHNTMGIALATQGKLDDAIEAFREALWIKPDLAGAHFNLAGCLLQKDQTEGAVPHYRAALQANPANPAAHYELGVALARLGNLDAAIEHYREALRIRPDQPGARRALENATQTQVLPTPEP